MSWLRYLSPTDINIYKKAGYGAKMTLGVSPALLILDVTTMFVGDKPEPIIKSIEHFPNSCGNIGWKAIKKMNRLLDYARRKNLPVIYTIGQEENNQKSLWAEKQPNVLYKPQKAMQSVTSIPKIIQPEKNELVIRKSMPSAFFGTTLLSHLIASKIDTLIVTGCTTSGCVRATVVDAFSYNYPVMVVEECTFDRGRIPHVINLFDMDQKYANVVSFEEAVDYMESATERNGKKSAL